MILTADFERLKWLNLFALAKIAHPWLSVSIFRLLALRETMKIA